MLWHQEGSRAPLALLRTYALAIPVALEEAAQFDGAKPWQIFLHIILPMMRPGLITVAIIVGLNAWNEFVIAVTFLQNEGNVTAIVKFYNLTGQYSTDWGEMLAAAIRSCCPWCCCSSPCSAASSTA